jgi:lysophospholipase L1-like esterase
MKSLAVLITGVGSALFLCGCEHGGGGGSPNVGDNNPGVVSCIGDSITENGNPPWPSIVASRTGKTVINRGRGGAKSDEGVGKASAALAADNPGYLTIQYGANDVGVGRSRESIVENLRAMVLAAKANQTVPVVATITPMYHSHELFAAEAHEVNRMIRMMASEEGAELADMEDAFGSDPSLFEDDGLHPNQTGIELMASVFASIVN